MMPFGFRPTSARPSPLDLDAGDPLSCPSCGSHHGVKNGRTHTGKPNHKCQNCGRQFVQDSQQKIISAETKKTIDKLLVEKIPLAGITRVIDVSKSWLQQYVNRLYEAAPREIDVSSKSPGKLTIECDEAWSFVGNKSNKQWIWLALDVKTREIVGVYVGDRSREGAKGLWASWPSVDRQCALVCTDFWESYETVIPAQRHRQVGKDSGKTNHIERFNHTLRQRVSRLVRQTLSFSKKLENHIGAIWYFVHHYNASLPV
jgi:IS1 family transposase/transposase-like protein